MENTQKTEEINLMAESGTSYPIRILNLVDGTYVIGFIIAHTQEAFFVLRPYQIGVSETEDNDIDSYDLRPYMDQLADFDPETLRPVPFMATAVISPVVPARHLINTYTTIIRMKERIATTTEDESLYTKEAPHRYTIH